MPRNPERPPSRAVRKVIYRGPYIKGLDDKPLLGETVRGL